MRFEISTLVCFESETTGFSTCVGSSFVLISRIFTLNIRRIWGGGESGSVVQDSKSDPF